MPGEVEQVRAARAGDRTALRALFDRHQRAVMGYCLLAADRDRERALDWTQETFARALSGLGRLEEAERFRGWLFSIAANVCRTRGAQESRRAALLAAIELEAEADPGHEPREREERIAAVQRVLAQISDESVREIARLKYGEPEHTTRQIAARLDLPHGTVTSKLQRFRASVRRELCRALFEEVG